MGGWVGPSAGLDAMVKRKIPSLYLDRENEAFHEYNHESAS
jgi:hypothetical protein